jgi:two-component sensor histidine kinase
VALQQSCVPQDLYEVALRTAGLGAWETDLAAGTRTWTEDAIGMFGIDARAGVPIRFVERDHLREVMHPEDRALLDHARALFLDRDEIEVAYRVLHPDLGTRHVAGRGRVIRRDAQGQPLRVVHLVSDVTARHETELRNAMLMRELTHRTKNQLAIVLAMARRIGRSVETIEEFQDAFAGRIGAMADSIDALVEPVWGTVPLKALVLAQLRGVVDAGSTRLILSGQDLEIENGASEALGMALHELACNARRHGALSDEHGVVEISWALSRARDGRPALTFEWTERNGPEVADCGPPGFGSTMLTSIAPSALDAAVEYRLRPSGAYWGLVAPIATPGNGGDGGPGIQVRV